MTSAVAVDQSQSPDDVAMATTENPPSAPSPTAASVDDSQVADIIPTSPPDDDEAVNGEVITPEEMNLAELKVRVVCQEKANAALRMELKCAELQVASDLMYNVYHRLYITMIVVRSLGCLIDFLMLNSLYLMLVL